jgi:tetrahydromethanopterin S-methyltransferase subunit A
MEKAAELNIVFCFAGVKPDEFEIDDSIMYISIENLHDEVINMFNMFDVSVRNLFLSDEDITKRVEELISRDYESEFISDFTITIETESDKDTLFDVYYSRKQSESVLDEDSDEIIIEYDDFDYQEFHDAIDNSDLILNNYEKVNFDHKGGEVQEKLEYLDLYYNFKKKQQN